MNRMVTIFFLCTLYNLLVKGSIVTNEELLELGLSCFPEDSCETPRTDDSPGISLSYSCSCDRLCSQFDTCCRDSYYNSVKPATVRPSCRRVQMLEERTAYFMVDRCVSGDNGESPWEKLCNEEWTTEDDLMRLIPVTSRFTFVTYKNYFCFRCYENTEDYFYWKVWLVGKSSEYLQPASGRTLQYRKDQGTLVATFNDKNISIPVDLKFDIPLEIWSLPVECVAGLISDCLPNWHNRTVRDKCRAYTSVVFAERDRSILKYKNVHCVLCNLESLENIGCKTDFNSSYLDEGMDLPVSISKTVDSEKEIFVFADLLDIFGDNKKKVEKKRRCKENFIWDKFRKSCRSLVCIKPGQVVIKNKCVKI